MAYMCNDKCPVCNAEIEPYQSEEIDEPAEVATGTKIYTGRIEADGSAIVMVDDQVLPLAPSLAVRDHSRTGFSWGYCGSGPSQLALALLLDCFSDVHKAKRLYQAFKFKVVALWPLQEDWKITSDQIEAICADFE